MSGAAIIVQGDALRLPLPDGSVDLIVTSPPFFALRAYGAGLGELGSEATPVEYLEALWAATAEMKRVLKPTGSAWINLGDKYSGYTNGQGKGRNAGGGERGIATVPDGPVSAPTVYGVPNKSLMLLPEAYRLGCTGMLAHLGGIDPGLNLIARAVTIWDKPNGLPESVQDRPRRSHEDWVMLTKAPRYYSAIDEIREAHLFPNKSRSSDKAARAADHVRGTNGSQQTGLVAAGEHPLGKLPGSVWSIPSEPLSLPGYFTTQDGTVRGWLAPERGARRPHSNGSHLGLFDSGVFVESGEDAGAWRWLRATGINRSPWPQTEDGLQLRVASQHYAAFPTRWPEQLIKAFSPPGICVECGQGRVPVVERGEPSRGQRGYSPSDNRSFGRTQRSGPGSGALTPGPSTILGYACACTPHTLHPERRRPSMTPRTSGSLPIEVPATGQQHAWPERLPVIEYHLDRWKAPPTRPAVVLDVFGGTGTTAMVARALGRIGVSVELSHAYSRAARWRVKHDGGKAISRTNLERQGQLL